MIVKRNHAITASNTSFSATIEKPISMIMLVLSFRNPAFNIFDISNLLHETKLALSLTTRDGKNVRLYNNVPLSAVAEYNSHNEGAIPLYSKGEKVNKIMVGIPICLDGALNMTHDETININLEGLPLDEEDSGILDMYGIEMPVRDYEVLQFHNLSVGAGVLERSFNLNEHQSIVLPDDASLVDVQINYSNNTTATYTLEELRLIQSQINDLVYVSKDIGLTIPDRVIAAYSKYFILDVENAVSIDITTVEDRNYTAFATTQKPVSVPSDAVAKNDKLVSTTDGIRQLQADAAENGVNL